MEIILIAALAKNRVIGRNNSIPWHIKEDLKHFRKTTSGSVVIMGRKTYESIGRPLPNRTNIVMTKNPKGLCDVIEVENKVKALKEASKFSNHAYVIGGEIIYKEFISSAKKMVLTEIDIITEGDTFFPEWEQRQWREVSRTENIDNLLKIKFNFVEYRRID